MADHKDYSEEFRYDDLPDPSYLKEILGSINQPQCLSVNLSNLKSNTFCDNDGGGTTSLLRLLQTHIRRGIDSPTVLSRRHLYGKNSLPSSPRKSFYQLFIDTFDETTVQILMLSAAVSLAVGLYDDPTTGYVEGLAILVAVLIVSIVTAINDYQKETQFREMSMVNDEIDVLVIRDGSVRQISNEDIVVGDLVRIESGDAIPCDGVLVHCDSLEVDESALTGEPVEVEKSIVEDPFVLSGCTTVAGSGTFVCIAVGRESQWGKIKEHLEKEQLQTPLQEKLDDMAATIGKVGMGAAALTFVAMMFIKLYIKPVYLDEVTVFGHALDAFIICVTIVVVAVPEGLPLAVTISLAYSTKKMLADNNLIRHLVACETMGNATNICSDKTGTLTENRMTVVTGMFANVLFNDTTTNSKVTNCLVHETCIAIGKISDHARECILQNIATCSTAEIDERIMENSTPSDDNDKVHVMIDDRPHIIGNKTEGSLLLLARSAFFGHDDYKIRRMNARFGRPGESRMFPFSSSRKCMSVIVHEDVYTSSGSVETSKQNFLSSLSSTKRIMTRSQHRSESKWTLYHKGAAETVLKDCTKYLDKDGSEKDMTTGKRTYFLQLIDNYTSRALRCVALAHRHNIDNIMDIAKITTESCEELCERELVLNSIVGIVDPLRKDVIRSVDLCRKAGIMVRMVTGDNLDTAKAIAKQAKILTDNGISMDGQTFRKLTPTQLDFVLPQLQVLARSSPEDKHMLVQRLNGVFMPRTKEEWHEAHPGRDFHKEKDMLLPGYYDEWAKSRNGIGEIVGVTGDGTNDGPALKAADVGLSMGLSGTDVAKNASDIIIMDDNFSSIVKAVLWGRSVFDNIRKFLQFQLTVNMVALTITFLSAIAGYKPPLNAVMMLWVNLIMDTMGALALGTEPPRKELLNRRPYRRDAGLISKPMWRNIFVQASYQLCLLTFLLKRGPVIFGCEDGSTHHFTIIFNAFVFCQVFNEFNAREIGDNFQPFYCLGQSPIFLAVILFTIIAQWIIVEYGGDFTQTHSLSEKEWKITALAGAISIPFGYLMRLIPVKENPESFAGIVCGGRIKGMKKHYHEFYSWTKWLVLLFAILFYQLYKMNYINIYLIY